MFYSDGGNEKLVYEVKGISGYRVYRIQEQAESSKEIVSYKAVLVADGKEIVSSSHHLWTEVIPTTRGDATDQLN